ncbi:hypothetical protein OIN81_18160, partial [Acinetobacter baumannii]|nr:hypothetical protein [Acinetobacter baumannii]
MNQTQTAAPRRRGIFGLALIALIMVSVLVSLGVWQLRRKDERGALVSALAERRAGVPGAWPAVVGWPALTPVRDEFRRVRFSAGFESKPDVMVYSSGSAVRD